MSIGSSQRGSFAFIGLLILAIVFMFLIWWVRSPEFPLRRAAIDEQTERELIERGVKYLVEITDKGFVPGVLRVAPYDTVSFVNRDARPHHPSSGDLDGKQACEEFGQGRELYRNEAYVVVFRAKGECAFHDRLDETFSAGAIFIQDP